MHGLGHRYCQNCGHAVYSGYGRSCAGCGIPFGEMLLLDEALDGGMWRQGGPSIGFDFMDDEPVFNLGDGLGIEPDGQLDVETPLGDFPI